MWPKRKLAGIVLSEGAFSSRPYPRRWVDEA
jgi:hypothetical protein